MKVARCIVSHREIKNMINELRALENLFKNPAVKSRFVASNFLEAKLDPGPLGKFLKRSPRLRIILAMDRWEGRPNGKTEGMPKMP